MARHVQFYANLIGSHKYCNRGFSVVKNRYSLEIALECYEELRRNLFDFRGRL